MKNQKDEFILMMLQEQVYALLGSFNKFMEENNEDIEEDSLMLMEAAILLKSAVELYTMALKDNEKIVHMLDVAKESINGVRDRLEYDKTTQTIH